MTRYSVTVGRFTVTDFFDNNRYTHDPRTQFMGWAVMYNGAWDYPADTRGYTWGWVHEFHTRNWSLRYGSAAEPKVANGLRFDRRLFVNRGDMFEGELRHTFGSHPGAVRLLGFLLHTRFRHLRRSAPTRGAERRRARCRSPRAAMGTLKYGAGISAEQEITKDLGVFVRLGWNDGKTESFAFTAIDRLASGGVSLTGTRWKRPQDTVATAFTVAGISGVHALYLARGGLDFLIGDGTSAVRRPNIPGKATTAPSCLPGSSPPSTFSTSPIPPTTRIAGRSGSPASACTWNSGRSSAVRRTRSRPAVPKAACRRRGRWPAGSRCWADWRRVRWN